MRVAVLGCTGGSGKEVVRQALDKGWEVVALARNPAKLDEYKHEKLQAIQCDIFNSEELARHFAGCGAVVSCLGVSGMYYPWSNVTIVQDAMKKIVPAMKTAAVDRLVMVSSWYTVPTPGAPWVMDWLVRPLILNAPLKDLRATEVFLKQQDGIDYTVLKPPHLVMGPPSGEQIEAVEGVEFVSGSAQRLNRGDVAHFILQCIEEALWIKAKVCITIKNQQ